MPGIGVKKQLNNLVGTVIIKLRITIAVFTNMTVAVDKQRVQNSTPGDFLPVNIQTGLKHRLVDSPSAGRAVSKQCRIGGRRHTAGYILQNLPQLGGQKRRIAGKKVVIGQTVGAQGT